MISHAKNSVLFFVLLLFSSPNILRGDSGAHLELRDLSSVRVRVAALDYGRMQRDSKSIFGTNNSDELWRIADRMERVVGNMLTEELAFTVTQEADQLIVLNIRLLPDWDSQVYTLSIQATLREPAILTRGPSTQNLQTQAISWSASRLSIVPLEEAAKEVEIQTVRIVEYLIDQVLEARRRFPIQQGANCSASTPHFLDLLNRPLEDILKVQGTPGRIQLIADVSGESDLPPCDNFALSFGQVSLASLTEVAATGSISFCLDPVTYRVVSASVAVHSLDGRDSEMPAHDFLETVGSSYRVSRRPTIEVEDGLAAVIAPCESENGEVEIWIFEGWKLEAYIVRTSTNKPMISSFHFGEGYGGEYPLCSDTSKP